MEKIDCPFVLRLRPSDRARCGAYWDAVLKIVEESQTRITVKSADENYEAPEILKRYLVDGTALFILEVRDVKHLPKAKKVLHDLGELFGESQVPFVGLDHKLEFI